MFHYLAQPEPFAIWDPTFLQVLAETQKKYEVLTDQYSKLHEQTTKLRYKKKKLELELEGIVDANRANKRRGPRRLKICDFRGRYICQFPQCCHEYGSELALNHHMRCKHGAGTKTQRELLAVWRKINPEADRDGPEKGRIPSRDNREVSARLPRSNPFAANVELPKGSVGAVGLR